MTKRILLGFLVALVIGAGTGAAIGPVAKSMAAPRVSDTRPPNIDLGRVVLEQVEGVVQLRDRTGAWVDLTKASRVSRPAKLRTVGADSEVALTFRGIRLVATHEAEFMLSAVGPEPAVLVSTGHVRVHRGAQVLPLYVPDMETKLIGNTFGVWVRDGEVAVSVLHGELEVLAPGRKAIKFARGRELVITARRVLPAVLEQQLQIQVQGTSRRGYRYTLTGRTAPHARVIHTDDKGEQRRLRVSAAGAFSVDLLDRRPMPGQLVAYDSAGRRAEVDKPSRSLDDVVAEMSGVTAPDGAKADGSKGADAAPAKTEGAAAAPGTTKPAPASPPPAAPPPAATKRPTPPPAAAPPPAAPPTTRAAKPVKRPTPRERGKRPPEPVKLELGGALKSKAPRLEEKKTEADPAKPAETRTAKPKPKAPPPAAPAEDEAL